MITGSFAFHVGLKLGGERRRIGRRCRRQLQHVDVLRAHVNTKGQAIHRREHPIAEGGVRAQTRPMEHGRLHLQRNALHRCVVGQRVHHRPHEQNRQPESQRPARYSAASRLGNRSHRSHRSPTKRSRHPTPQLKPAAGRIPRTGGFRLHGWRLLVLSTGGRAFRSVFD